jgi:hypothetical protein
MAQLDRLSLKERETLLFAMVWAPTASVAISFRSAKTIRRLLEDLDLARGELAHEVLTETALDLAVTMNQFTHDNRDSEDLITEACQILEDKFPPTEANAFKATMYELARRAAMGEA